MGRIFLVVLPVLAICTFLIVRKQYGGFAPAPPTTVEDDTAFTNPRTAQLQTPTTLQPTVLAPENTENGSSLPPGTEPDSLDLNPSEQDSTGAGIEFIPIPDLQQPTTLLEFPSLPSE